MSSVYYPAHVLVLFNRFIKYVNHFLLRHPSASDSRSESVKWLWPSILLSSSQTTGDLSLSEPSPAPFERSNSNKLDTIHKLLENPALYDPLRVPRNPIVLCHGLYGFDTRGPSSFPSLQIHYWANALNVLRDKMKAEVIVTAVPGTGSISTRAESLDRQLQERAPGRGLNFMAHSMGGLDCRHLISHVKPTKYKPLSLTTISTPHRGSPFMDWCSENLGLGKLAREEKRLLSKTSHRSRSDQSSQSSSSPKESRSTLSLSSLPSSFTTLLLSILDSPAYANLTSAHLNNVFNPATPNDPRVKYFSVAGRMPAVSIWHPLWLPKFVLDDFEQKERQRLRASWEEKHGDFQEIDAQYRPLWALEDEWGNDCLVTVQSSKWGEFLGVMEGCDHWTIRGARGIELGVELPAIPSISLGSSSGGGGGSTSSNNHSGGGGSNENKQGGQDGLGIRDLGWFLRAWKKEETVQREALARLPEGSGAGSSSDVRQREREMSMKRDKDDAVIKASTDHLSAVFDWVSDRVPSPPYLGTKTTTAPTAPSRGPESVKSSLMKDPKKKSELESKEDLERFFVALSRKLYDEGL
ncbi:hypothetical protein D9757_007161 [Collybiopsis confluens]|uniref:Alpha/beta-hydrolase n=1 Tax=Collybiopsis confluens TaxID=2823264 RepID=A0A8H5HCK8_9AGAR|nr:hypothetical protein D9757_007161 [Collybiopsis confluens]